MELLRTHYITKDPSKFELINFGNWSMSNNCLGFNYRMNDIQAALGLSQLKRISCSTACSSSAFKYLQE